MTQRDSLHAAILASPEDDLSTGCLTYARQAAEIRQGIEIQVGVL